MERIIVRRGRFLTYELLRRTFGGDPNVEIVWDRRWPADNPSGRGSTGERRGRPPVEWDRLDYIFTSGKSSDVPACEPQGAPPPK